MGLPTSLAQDTSIAPLLVDLPIATSGVHPLGLAAPDGDPFVVVSLETLPPKTPIRYRTGPWPKTGFAVRYSSYAPPTGFIRVTPENVETSISERFVLRDFLTHDQQNVWRPDSAREGPQAAALQRR